MKIYLVWIIQQYLYRGGRMRVRPQSCVAILTTLYIHYCAALNPNKHQIQNKINTISKTNST